jgi:hypothetical protein
LMSNDPDSHDRPTQPISRQQIQRLREEPPAETVDEEAIGNSLPVDREVRDSAQDQIATPVPIVVPHADYLERNRPGRASGVLWGLAILALVISLASLALNGVLIYKLLSVGQTTADGLDAAIAALQNLEGQGFRYEYHFSQTVPFSGDIPFKQDLVFPFKGNIPINTTVSVPINAGMLGTITVDVPINTVFPVDLEVPIKVDQTIHVDTAIPLDMVIPIEIKGDDPAIQKLIDQILEWLVSLRNQF